MNLCGKTDTNVNACKGFGDIKLLPLKHFHKLAQVQLSTLLPSRHKWRKYVCYDLSNESQIGRIPVRGGLGDLNQAVLERSVVADSPYDRWSHRFSGILQLDRLGGRITSAPVTVSRKRPHNPVWRKLGRNLFRVLRFAMLRVWMLQRRQYSEYWYWERWSISRLNCGMLVAISGRYGSSLRILRGKPISWERTSIRAKSPSSTYKHSGYPHWREAHPCYYLRATSEGILQYLLFIKESISGRSWTRF